MCNILQPIAYIASEQNLSVEELQRFYSNLTLIIDMLIQAMPSLQSTFASVSKDPSVVSESSNDVSSLRTLVRTLVQLEPDTIRQLKDAAQTFLPILTNSIDMTGMQSAMQNSMSGIQSMLSSVSPPVNGNFNLLQQQQQQMLNPATAMQSQLQQQPPPQFDIASLLSMFTQQQQQQH
jgi:hypothetical protein